MESLPLRERKIFKAAWELKQERDAFSVKQVAHALGCTLEETLDGTLVICDKKLIVPSYESISLTDAAKEILGDDHVYLFTALGRSHYLELVDNDKREKEWSVEKKSLEKKAKRWMWLSIISSSLFAIFLVFLNPFAEDIYHNHFHHDDSPQQSSITSPTVTPPLQNLPTTTPATKPL